jgi:hypothetical protein
MNRQGLYATSACILATISACRGVPGRQVDVRITSSRPPSLSTSSHWNLPSHRSQRVESDGNNHRARIPFDQLPLPYLDLNHNGSADLGIEPTGRCTRGNAWTCAILAQRLTVHRVQSADDDSTFVFGEAFKPDSFAKDIWRQALQD